METVTLYDILSAYRGGQNARLTDSEIEGLVKILGYRARYDTKARLEGRLRGLFFRNNYLFKLVIVRPEVRYVAGQDYPAEVALIRKLILA